MQLVILAAGRGTRMKSLTESMPKPLLSVLGNNLIEHKLSVLPKEIDEIIIVVGYLGEKIRAHFGENFNGRKIRYVEQKELLGTMMALKQAESIISGKFMVMMGDDLYSKDVINECLKHEWAVLVKKMEGDGKGALVQIDKNNHITDIVEGVELRKGMLNNAGLYVLEPEIFKYPLVQIPSGEFGLPQTLVKAAKDFDINVVETTNGWLQISSPEDLEKVEKIMSEGKKS